MVTFLVERFGDRLRVFAEDYLGDAPDHADWTGSRVNAASTLVTEIEAMGSMGLLWQGLRDELVAVQPAFADAIDRLEQGWRSEDELRWEAIKLAAGTASQAVLDDLDHDSATYVPRPEADEVVTSFLEGDHPAMILTGPAGVGKTSFAVETLRTVTGRGDGVLFLAGKWMNDNDIWDQIATRLELGERRPIELLGERATAGGGQLLVIVDGIHEVPSTEGGVSVFKSLNARLDDLPTSVKVLVTVTESSWRRLERRVRTDIRRGRYFSPRGELTLSLQPFDDDQLAEAWSRYREAFAVSTEYDALPNSLRRPLRIPALMTLLAQAYAGGSIPEAEVVSASDFFKRYFEVKVGSDDERRLVDGLAAAMYEAGRTPLAQALIADNADLRELLAATADSPYARLVDKDVIRELEEARSLRDARFVEYTIQRFGAWVLASYLAERTPDLADQVELIIEASAKFATYPPAWDAATMLLVQAAEDEVYVRLAASDRSEVRELVVSAIAELAAFEETRTRGILSAMLAAEDGPSRQTALRAAYRATVTNPDMTFDAEFIAIARGADDELRQILHDTLYLIWRRDPDYTIGVLQTLVEQLDRGQVMRRFWELPETRRLLELVAQVAITLYTTNPNLELGRAIGDLGHELIMERLRVAGLMSNSLVQGVLFPVVDRRFSEHIYRGFLVGDPEAIEVVFALDSQAKEDIRTGIGLLDPDRPVAAGSDALHRLFDATDSDFSSLLAAQAMAVHLVREFDTAEPVARSIHERGGFRTRVWLLTSFLVLLETTPAEWVPLLEELTASTVENHLEEFRNGGGILTEGHIDQVLLPLGLAYGKRAVDMPLLLDLATESIAEGDAVEAARVINVLGSVGFHHPRVARDALWSIWEQMSADDNQHPAELTEALVQAMTTIRALYPDIVDDLVADIGDETVEASFRTAPQPAWLRSQVSLLGLYNNGVHIAVCNPIMRTGLLEPIYSMLVEGPDLATAVKGLTKRAWDLAAKHDYHLDRWMGPATGGICC